MWRRAARPAVGEAVGFDDLESAGKHDGLFTGIGRADQFVGPA
jgi:hypothetical protein